MATCDVTNGASSPQDFAEYVEGGEENEMSINMNDAEIFQKDIGHLTVVDVYNIAASVGREFEKLTDAFGGAVFSDVMPKMIRVLEMLESFAERSQNCPIDVLELQAAVQKLQIEGKTNAVKHKEDLDMVENAWREETRQLLQSVETLQKDNKRLTQILTENVEASTDSQNNNDQQNSVSSDLGESFEKQRDEIREKNRLIEQQSADFEALTAQAQQLTKLNVNLRRKVAIMEQQAATMANQNTDMESTCKEKDRQIKELQKRLSDNTRALEPIKEEVAMESIACEAAEAPTDPLLANKLVIDMNDPDRPRYTMHELKEVLEEKNRLKYENFLKEEELKYYRQFFKRNGKEESWEEIDPHELSDFPLRSEVNNNRKTTSHKSEGGIRKLFASIFSRDVNSRMPQKSAPRKSTHVSFDLPMKDYEYCDGPQGGDNVSINSCSESPDQFTNAQLVVDDDDDEDAQE